VLLVPDAFKVFLGYGMGEDIEELGEQAVYKVA